MLSRRLSPLMLAIAACLGPTAATLSAEAPTPLMLRSVPSLHIVQSTSAAAASREVQALGVKVEQELPIINAVSAYLTPAQTQALNESSAVRVFADRVVKASGLFSFIKSLTNSLNSTLAQNDLVSTTTGDVVTPVVSTVTTIPLVSDLTEPLVETVSSTATLQDGTGVNVGTLLYETNYPALIGADVLQRSGITGKGVTIAVLDTGLWQDLSQNYGTRILATVDVTNGGSRPVTGDPYGHGTHITSIAASGAQNLSGGYLGIAPKSNLVVVRAFNGEGGGRYSDVIAGLNWIVQNRVKYKIRVLNLSFGSAPVSYYWDDPLNQAVMAAWRAGIVVVVSAGNEGPSPMTIDVPGNVPYVITVGALTDSNTPYDATDDRLASFSSTGPTYEGFVKPEIVAPGGHIAASMSSSSYLANIDPDSMKLGQQMFTMSGTSQAAAVTSGVVALMLQDDPTLTPDQVKCRLIVASRPAVTSSGKLAYSVFQQGAGLINAVEAVNGSATNCANNGLNITNDINGTEHFGGPANIDANGNFYIMNMEGWRWAAPVNADGYSWSKGYPWNQGFLWSDGYSWSQGYSWSKGYSWSQGYSWSKGYSWSMGYSWSKTVPWWNEVQEAFMGAKPASIATWVPNE